LAPDPISRPGRSDHGCRRPEPWAPLPASAGMTATVPSGQVQPRHRPPRATLESPPAWRCKRDLVSTASPAGSGVVGRMCRWLERIVTATPRHRRDHPRRLRVGQRRRPRHNPYGVAAARAWSGAAARRCVLRAGFARWAMGSGATLLLPAAAMRLGWSSSSVVLHGRAARTERPVLAARARSPTGLAGSAVARDEGLRGCRRASRTRVGRAGCGCASRSGRPLLRPL
jgi:hypothetical protein